MPTTISLIPPTTPQTDTSRSESLCLSGRRSTLSTIANMAVAAPIPNAIVNTAIAVNEPRRRNARTAYRESNKTPSIDMRHILLDHYGCAAIEDPNQIACERPLAGERVEPRPAARVAQLQFTMMRDR